MNFPKMGSIKIAAHGVYSKLKNPIKCAIGFQPFPIRSDRWLAAIVIIHAAPG